MPAQAEKATSTASDEALRLCLLFGLASMAALMVGQALSLEPHPYLWRDGSTLVVGRDFMNFWMYGQAARQDDPGAWYDIDVYQRALTAFLGPDYPRAHNWSYPPSVMLAAAPFGLLGYLTALALWSLIGLAVFVLTLRAQGADWRVTTALIAGPAAAFCLISGQSSLIAASILLGALSMLDRRPLVAGALIGLLTLKPQLGVMFPLMLIVSGRWLVFLAAAATTLAIFAVSTALFGLQPWLDFVAKGLPVQNLVLADPAGIATPFYVTIFMNLRGIGVPYGPAMAVQAVFAVAAAAAVCWAFRARRKADPMLLTALFLACAVTATPYLLSYDSLPLSAAALSGRLS